MIHPKAALIERLQKEGRGQPQFVTTREGPDHEPIFRAQAKVQGQVFGNGEGGNKREAERRAAEAALARLDREASGKSGKRRRKGGGASEPSEAVGAQSATPPAATQPDAEPVPEPFGGPWPVFDRVLAESLRVAHQRVDPELRGDVALAGIEAFALRLYKDVLEDLGEVVEEG